MVSCIVVRLDREPKNVVRCGVDEQQRGKAKCVSHLRTETKTKNGEKGKKEVKERKQSNEPDAACITVLIIIASPLIDFLAWFAFSCSPLVPGKSVRVFVCMYVCLSSNCRRKEDKMGFFP
jgi:hypothetical protein